MFIPLTPPKPSLGGCMADKLPLAPIMFAWLRLALKFPLELLTISSMGDLPFLVRFCYLPISTLLSDASMGQAPGLESMVVGRPARF